jgi:hypothetical protein
VICPSGCLSNGASSCFSDFPKNISVSSYPKSLLELFASHPTRGAYRDRHGRRGGMRWTRQRFARDGIAGRVAERPVSGHQASGREMLQRTAKSCGPDASVVGVKSAEGKSARPGADEPAIRRRRRQQSPILRGEREVSRKAIAQGTIRDKNSSKINAFSLLYSPLCRDPLRLIIEAEVHKLFVTDLQIACGPR